MLWKSAICLKFIKIVSLLSRTIRGTFFSGLSIVLMYLSTTAWRSFPNSSSVSTSSRMTALIVISLRFKIYQALSLYVVNTYSRRYAASSTLSPKMDCSVFCPSNTLAGIQPSLAESVPSKIRTFHLKMFYRKSNLSLYFNLPENSCEKVLLEWNRFDEACIH